jgi:SAM-dependent methyltransferase
VKRYYDANRGVWDAWTAAHRDSAFYELDRFRAGESSLNALELQEVADVAGKSLLHLQCHFGLDTLSWARAGASVTGVDFSPDAVAAAKALSEELGIVAEFVCSDVYALPEVLGERTFDVVFTSYGVLSWLDDLERWAGVVARHLKPGGTFYIVEFHPVLGMLDEEGRIAHPYFHSAEPQEFVEQGSYGDRSSTATHTLYQWAHSLADVVNALIGAGLRIEFLHEFPYSVHDCEPFFHESAPRRFEVRDHPGMIPLMFSIRATR